MDSDQINSKHFKANDIYSVWSKNCKLSKSTISVLSPYVDNTVMNLLDSNSISPHVEKKIYTRIDSDTIFDKPYQIRALINCIKKGISIYHIIDLHAKALVIDNQFISVGSQNFTSQGRKNKETSMMSLWNFNSSKYFQVIQSWMDSADKIDIDYLLSLESKLKKFRKKIADLRNDHQHVFDKILNDAQERKKQELSRNLLILKAQTKTQFASEYIYLTRTDIDNWVNSITTFKVDSGRDLTLWKVPGQENPTFLARLEYYPCIQSSNNSIAFVRLAKTRISFFLTKIGFGSYNLKEEWYRIIINCPQENTTHVNFQISLSKWNTGENELDFYFNGFEFNFLAGRFTSNSEKQFIMENLVINKEEKDKLLQKCFQGHYIETLGRPITKLFDGRYYKLYIVEFMNNPVIVAEKRI